MADGCSAHLLGGVYRGGNVALPDMAAFVIERVSFEGDVSLEATHHCNVGVTGVLCSPTYVFDRVTWRATSARWMYFSAVANNRGGVFVLAPPEEPNPSGHIFPPSFCALASATHAYLLALKLRDGEDACVTAASLGLATRYDDGILCRRPLRALRLYTRGLSTASAPQLSVELWQGGARASAAAVAFHVTGGDGATKKQGYALPVATGDDVEYRVALADGSPLPAEWIIEFSDPIFGHRWRADRLRLSVRGRDCGGGEDGLGEITSQHDRRFLWAGVAADDHLVDAAWGRGACSRFPDMPSASCGDAARALALACDGCGDEEASEVCAAARCGEHGACVARWLGGQLPVVARACACEPPWTGSRCTHNPCEGRSCGGRGTCVGVGDQTWRCECDAGFSGRECEFECGSVCAGSAPSFGCSAARVDAFQFCGPAGGCQYAPALADGNAGWCAYSTDDACGRTRCDAASDCYLGGACASGACANSTPAALPDSTPCNSAPYGQCHRGVCVAGAPPAPSGGVGGVGIGGFATLTVLAVAVAGAAAHVTCRRLKRRGDLGRARAAPRPQTKLLGEWVQATAHGHAYYYNVRTGESSWTLPGSAAAASPPAGAPADAVAGVLAGALAGASDAGGEWVECTTEEGRAYWYNARTGVSQWVLPEGQRRGGAGTLQSTAL